MSTRPSTTLNVDDAERDDRTWAWALFLVAVAWRAIHVLTVRHSPLFDNLFIDPGMYDQWARRIAAGQLLGDAPFFLDPFYPYFVGGVYALFGRSYLAIAAIQSLLGALVPPLVFLAARPWFERPVARVAGLIAVFYPLAVYYEAVLMKPALALFFVALTLWLLSRSLSRDGWPNWLGAGAALGLAGLTRGHMLLVVPVLAVFVLCFASPARSVSAPRDWRWPATSWLLGGVACMLLLPAMHNFAASGELIPSTTNWGQIFFIGNNASNPDGRFRELPFVRSDPTFEQIDFKREAERRVGSALGHRAVSQFWFAAGLDWARAHPVDWTRLMWSKLRIFWGAYETPASLDYYFYRRHAPLLQLPLPAFGLLGPFALLGFVLAWPRRRWPRLIVTMVIATSILVATFFVLTRFRMVVMPALYVLAAFGAVELVRLTRDAIRGGRRLTAAVAVMLLLAFSAYVNIPVQATADSWRYRIAEALQLPRRLETTARARWNLGVSYAGRAKDRPDSDELLRLAEQELRAALREDAQPANYLELGKVLARLRRNEEAIEIYRKVAELEPRDFRTRHVLGLLYRRVGNAEAAETAFRQALSITGQHTASIVQLGEVLLQRGRNMEAAEQFRRALDLRPDDRAAREGLAAAGAR